VSWSYCGTVVGGKVLVKLVSHLRLARSCFRTTMDVKSTIRMPGKGPLMCYSQVNKC
jgi:hypothetical protein